MHWFRPDGADLLLQVQVQPRASRDAVVGIIGDYVKIRLTAPPVAGKANEHLIAYMARVFGVPKTSVKLEHGRAAKRKLLRIHSPQKLPENLPWSTASERSQTPTPPPSTGSRRRRD
ncbi:MAG: DUF167 family protein [Sulfuricaulis sp.]